MNIGHCGALAHGRVLGTLSVRKGGNPCGKQFAANLA